jgi:hypothetical protein
MIADLGPKDPLPGRSAPAFPLCQNFPRIVVNVRNSRKLTERLGAGVRAFKSPRPGQLTAR